MFPIADNAPASLSGTFRLGCSIVMVARPRKASYASTLIPDDKVSLPLQSSMGYPSFVSGDAANSYALPPRHPPFPVSNAREPHSQPNSRNHEGTRPASTSTLLTTRQASGAAMRRPHSAAPAVSMTSSALPPGSMQQARTGPGSSASEQEGDWQPQGERLTAAGGEASYAIWHMALGKPTREAVSFVAPYLAHPAEFCLIGVQPAAVVDSNAELLMLPAGFRCSVAPGQAQQQKLAQAALPAAATARQEGALMRLCRQRG